MGKNNIALLGLLALGAYIFSKKVTPLLPASLETPITPVIGVINPYSTVPTYTYDGVSWESPSDIITPEGVIKPFTTVEELREEKWAESNNIAQNVNAGGTVEIATIPSIYLQSLASIKANIYEF